MQAVIYRRYGSPDVLEYAQIDKPEPKPGEVLVEVRAASVNPYDWHLLRGKPSFVRVFTGIRRPKSERLGADVAGVIAATGATASRFQPGDAVFGKAKGSFAEYACAKETDLALKPDQVSFEEAASVPIAGLTALQGLRDCGRVGPGQRVLINGAAGGVGTFAVQIGRWLGATVTGVCSTRNVAMVASLGAETVIDYTREDFTRLEAKFDVIFDLVGNQALDRLRGRLESKGTFVGCGGGGPETTSKEMLGMVARRMVLSPFVSQKLTGALAKMNAADLKVLGELLQSGKIKAVLDRSYGMSGVGEAIRYVEEGHARGKVIIVM